MQSHVVIPNIGESLRRAAESFLHLAKDATTINSNFYGNHGTPKLSLEFLMRGCEFYSSQEDSGGDLAALFILSSFMTIPYLVFRILKDSTISAKNQVVTGVNDIYLLPDDHINNTEKRHVIAQWIGTPGWVVGEIVRGAIYFGGLCGISFFGYHRAAKALINCTNFLFDRYDSTRIHTHYLSLPRAFIPTVLNHFNLMQLVNGACYGMTAIAAGLGLTVYSMRFMRHSLNKLSQVCYQRDIFRLSEEEKNTYERTPSLSLKGVAHYGMLGWVGVIAGGFAILSLKCLHRGIYILKDIIDVSRRFVGFSQYGFHTIARAYKNCWQFITGMPTHIEIHQQFIEAHKANYSINNLADRSWVGLNRILNGLGYVVTFLHGVLGFTVHSAITMKITLNRVSEYFYQKKIFSISENDLRLHNEVARFSKEWFARFGLLGMVGTVIGAGGILFQKICAETFSFVRRLLGFSSYGMHTLIKSTSLCLNFIFNSELNIQASQNFINTHKTNPNQTIFSRADRSWIGLNRVINGFNYCVAALCGVAGLTVHSLRTMCRTLNVVNIYCHKTPLLIYQGTHNVIELFSKEWFAQFGVLGIIGIVTGSSAIVLTKIAHDASRFTKKALGFSCYSYHTILRSTTICLNFIFGSKIETRESEDYINKHKAAPDQNIFHRVERSWIGINRVINGFIYVATAFCGFIGFTAHSMQMMVRAINIAYRFCYSKDLFVISEHKENLYQQHQRFSKEWFARFGFLGLAGTVVGSSIIVFMKSWHLVRELMDLTSRLVGFSKYALNTIEKAHLYCINFIFGEEISLKSQQDFINQHKADPNQTIFKRADRSWIGINRVINGLQYGFTFFCGVMGLTVHSTQAMHRALNFINQKINYSNLFNIGQNEKEYYENQKRFSKEWFARFGVLGVVSTLVGGTLIVSFSELHKLLDFTRRIVGFSKYAYHTFSKACSLCCNFIFDFHYDTSKDQYYIDQHKGDPNQTLLKRADRSWIGINRILNVFSYTITAFLGILGLTAHSMQKMYRSLNVIYQLYYHKDLYLISEQEQEAYERHKQFSKEWFARFGLLGVAGTVIGTTVISFIKACSFIRDLLDLTRRLAGFTFYALNTLSRAYIYCVNFIFGEQLSPKINEEHIANHKADPNQSLFKRADRSWIGINRFVNGLQYGCAIFFGITGFTIHARQSLYRALNFVNQKIYHCDIFEINQKERDAYDQHKFLSKEWFARFGLASLAGIVVGSTIICLKKLSEKLINGLDLLRRFVGFSIYSYHTLARSFKKCANFIFGSQWEVNANQSYIDQHKTKPHQTIYDKADRSWFGVNRLINGFNSSITFVCGVIGFNIHGLRSLRKELNYIYKLFYERDLLIITEEEKANYNAAVPYSKEWYARGGVLVLATTAVAIITIPFLRAMTEAWRYLVETLDFSRRMLGFSMYAMHSIARAAKNSYNFIFGTQFDTSKNQLFIDQHKAKDQQTWYDWADRNWIGVHRILNGFHYGVAVFCGVTGLTVHSMRAMRRFINGVANFTYRRDIFNISEIEQETYENTERLSKEWFARAGLLGVMGIVFGTTVILVVKIFDKSLHFVNEVLDITRRALGFSLFGLHSVMLALKNSANYVFGTHFQLTSHLEYINVHISNPNDSIYDKAERNWFGLHRIIVGCTYLVSGTLGILGLTAANVHRAIRAFKRVHNLVSGDDQQKSLALHDAFLNEMHHKNFFTRVTSNWNLLYPASSIIAYGVWAFGSLVTFCIRTVWKFTLGNLFSFSSACGNDGVIQVISRQCVNDSAISLVEDKSNPAYLRLVYREENPIKKMQHHFYDLLWALEPTGELPERKEGETMSYEQAIVHSKTMGLIEAMSWRFAYEIRKSVSLFSLDSIPEKIILHFASTFKRYIKEARIRGELDSENIVKTFFGSEYSKAVAHVEKQYNKKIDKETVRTVAEAIKNDIMQTIHDEKKVMYIK